MMDDELPPRRLLDSEGPAGDCLRRALVEQELNVPRFVRLREKRLFRQRLQRAAWALAIGGVALLLMPKARPDTTPPSISAERASSGTQAPAEKPLASPSIAVAEPPSPRAAASSAAQAEAPRLRKLPVANARNEPEAAGPPSPQPSAAAVRAPSGSAKACAELARRGAASEALGCYEQLASGSGMGAELALFEQARLEGKVLRQPGRALATLDAHRRRFPQGSLRAEVMLAQIEWLMAAGDRARARTLVDEALASGLLKERTPELERLRASLQPAGATPD